MNVILYLVSFSLKFTYISLDIFVIFFYTHLQDIRIFRVDSYCVLGLRYFYFHLKYVRVCVWEVYLLYFLVDRTSGVWCNNYVVYV